VEKRPGFGRKAERLEARLPPAESARAPDRAPRIAVIGAGIAGAALVRAFRALGAEPFVIEAETPGAGASGNPAALAMARLDAGGGALAQLHAQAMARAADLYGGIPGAALRQGVLQLEAGPKDASRFDRIAEDPLFEPGAMLRQSAAEAGARLGEASDLTGLAIRDAVVVEPDVVLGAWLARAPVRKAMVAALERAGDEWRLIDKDGREIARADIVCIAAGAGAAALAPDRPLAPVRGQASFIAAPEAPAPAIGAGYLIPTPGGLLFGATHDRGDADTAVRAADHARNLDLLAQIRPALAASLDPAAVEGRASLRAVTPDFLPLAGPVDADTGLYILSGLGSRGFCTAPLLAEHVAALALGVASPLPQSLSEIVAPGRFEQRRTRRLGRSIGASTGRAVRPNSRSREETS
jgi:tRNA 5-methylaminomethyl-2-thiouridine biosynthesis bifunctional protein